MTTPRVLAETLASDAELVAELRRAAGGTARANARLIARRYRAAVAADADHARIFHELADLIELETNR